MFYYLWSPQCSHNLSLTYAVRTRPGFTLISVLFISSPVVGSWGELWAVGSVYTMFRQVCFARWFLKYRSPIWRKPQNNSLSASWITIWLTELMNDIRHEIPAQYVHCICFYSSFMCHTHLVESNWHFRGIAFLEKLSYCGVLGLKCANRL